jgi:hypothetical protein
MRWHLVCTGLRLFELISRAVLALALGVHSSAAVPRPSGSSFMPLRCAHQAPGLRIGAVAGLRWIAHCVARAILIAAQRRIANHVTGSGYESRRMQWNTRHTRESWSAVYSAQRHKGGVGCPRQPRRTAAELSTPSASSCTRDRVRHVGQLQRSQTQAKHRQNIPPASTRRHPSTAGNAIIQAHYFWRFQHD